MLFRSELAYFSAQLEENDYEGKYFKLSNDIMLNKGIFKYDPELKLKLQYILDENTYYLDGYTGKYYEDEIEFDEEIGLVNLFKSLNGFKGFFDGSSFTIYGLYVADEDEKELALFTNLEGEIHNLNRRDFVRACRLHLNTANTFQSFRVCKWHTRNASTMTARIDAKNKFSPIKIVVKFMIKLFCHLHGFWVFHERVNHLKFFWQFA